MAESERSPPACAAEARKIACRESASAVTSPPKSEIDPTRTTARPTARSPSTVPVVPPVIAPVVTAPSPYDQLTTDAADCGGDEIAPAEAGALPGTTTRTPNALADGAGRATTAEDDPAVKSARRRKAPKTTRRRTARGYRRKRLDWRSVIFCSHGDREHTSSNRGAARRAAHIPPTGGVHGRRDRSRRRGLQARRRRPGGLRARPRSQVPRLVQGADEGARMGPAALHVVCRRRAQRGVELPRPPRRGGAWGPGRLPLGRRARRRCARPHLRRDAGRGLTACQRPPKARRRQGRPGRHLHGHGPGAADRNAR